LGKTFDSQFDFIFKAPNMLELLQILSFSIKYLKALGLWKWDDSPRIEQTIVAVVIHLLPISFTILQICAFLQLSDFEELSQVITVVLSYIGMHCKVLNALLQLEKLPEILDVLKSLLQHSEWKESRDLAAIVKRTNTIFKCYLALSVFCMIPDLAASIENHQLTYKMYLPEGDAATIFWTASFYQFLCNLLNIPLTIVLDFLPVFLMSFAVGLYEELHKLIAALQKDNQEELKELIAIQLKLNCFIDQIIDCFSAILLIQAGLSCWILCTSAFVLSHVSFH